MINHVVNFSKTILAAILIVSVLSGASYASYSVVKTAKSYLGIKYKWGGCTRKGFDCSGFVKTVYKKHGKRLPRVSRDQASAGKHVDKKNLRAGDLVFFSSRHTKRIAHVGIFIGKGKFIHASSGKHRVTISSLSKKYYRQHYKGARRL
jgi:cell wall-associated NlpC family hydrolase